MSTPSSTEQNDANKREWLAVARDFRLRINAGWWFQAFVPWFVGGGLLSFLGVFLWRSQGTPVPVWPTVGIGFGLLLVLAAIAWQQAKRKFLTPEEALVRLEADLRLHCALTAAQTGVRSWPEVPRPLSPRALPTWNWRWFAFPKLVVGGFLVAAFLLPVTLPESRAKAEVPPPSSVEQTDKMLEELTREEAVRKQDLEKFQEQVDALKQKPTEEWYDHSNLEAADHLKSAVQSAAGGLSQNLGKAEQAINSLSQENSQQDEATRSQAASDLASSVQAMQQGAMQPNEELLKQLQGLDPEELKNGLTKEQADKLREQMQKAQAACKECEGQGQGQGEQGGGEGGGQQKDGNGQTLEEKLREQLKQGGKPQDDQASGQGENGEGNGKGQKGAGGVSRGPGTVDLDISDDPSELENGKLRKAQTTDVNNLKPGDLLGTSDGQHEVDKAPLGPMEGGASAAGDGGNATWRNELSPHEKQILERFFK